MSRFTPVKIHVCFAEKTQPFICGVEAMLPIWVLEKIESDLQPSGECGEWMDAATPGAESAVITGEWDDEDGFTLDSVEFSAPGAESEEPGT